MTRSWYELEYRAGDRWFPAHDGDGHALRYDNITPARAALNDHGTGWNGSGWRLVRVEEIRTPV